MELDLTFPIGALQGTRGVMGWALVADEGGRKDFLLQITQRHCKADWGDVCHEDRQTNDDALHLGGRLVSAYKIPEAWEGGAPDDKVWIITESDRSYTTIMFPSEY